MKLSKGFTLIELLIVIGVLGILASGLLAAVDPFEQLKKARDANNRNAAVETLNGMTRYYATHGVLPWNSTLASCVDQTYDNLRLADTGDYPHKVVMMSNTTTVGYDPKVNACVSDSLIADGELKSAFFSGLSTKFYIGSGNATKVVVCYAPEGKALRNDVVAVNWTYDSVAKEVTAGCIAADRTLGKCVQCFE